MASFETHLTVASVVVGCLTVPLLSASIVTPYEGVLLLFFGTVGGLLPDLDSDNSIPIKIAFKLLSLIVPLLLIFNFMNDLTLLKIILLWIFLTLCLYLLFYNVLLKLTVHRGVFHTLGMGVIFGGITTEFLLHVVDVDISLSILCGVYLSLGFFVHLLLDEIYSVNLLGARVKKSFGSAFKLYYKKNLLGSLFVNIMAIYIIFLMSDFQTIFLKIFHTLETLPLY